MDIKDKISVVIPTLNEEKSIKNTLDSLLNQSYQPDEIIISDGDSKDKTLEIINKYIEKENKIKIINRKGRCRGSGRNTGIEIAKNNLIALIDAGTIADRNWIKNLLFIKKRIPNVEVVYGSVSPKIYNLFTRNISNVIFGKNFISGKLIPSVSSLLLEKHVWEKIGKFPESNDGSYIVEDLKFLNDIKRLKFKSHIEEFADVKWIPPKNLLEVFNRFSEYSTGAFKEGFGNIWHKGLFRNVCFFLLILILSFIINSYLIFFLIILIFYRSYLYLKNMPHYFNKKNIIFIDIIITSFLLIWVDLSSIYGVVKYIKKMLLNIKLFNL